MPRPPVLEVLNWEDVYSSGLSFADWLAIAEDEEKRENMRSKAEAVQPGAEIVERLEKLKNPAYVVAIAEDWCGDVVRHVPALEALNSRSDKVNVRYISREQHRDVFVRFLTNGGEAIPKFVFLNKNFVENGNWGPMPNGCRRLIAIGKAKGDVKSARAKISEIYKNDPELVTDFEELIDLLEVASGCKEI